MKFSFSSIFRRGKKKRDSLKLEKDVIACKHYVLPISSIEIIDFEISLGDLSILPNEVLELILSHLPPNELVKATLISRAFWVMCCDDIIWKRHYKAHSWQEQETMKDDSSHNGSNNNSTVPASSQLKTPCCWKEHFKRRYASHPEIKGRFETLQQKLSLQINLLAKQKQQEKFKLTESYQRSVNEIDLLVVALSVMVYMICFYNLWEIFKTVWDVAAFLPYTTFQYWFSYCFDFEHGLVLQCWNADGTYYKKANVMSEALLESSITDEYCTSLVFPCFIIRGWSTFIWISCIFWYGLGIMFGIFSAGYIIRFYVQIILTTKPFTEYFPSFDVEQLKRRHDAQLQALNQRYADIDRLQNELQRIHFKLSSLQHANSKSPAASANPGYSCIVM